jgi:GPN-loop GTPase
MIVKDESMNRLMKDLEIDRAKNPHMATQDRWDPEEEMDDDDDTEIGIIDRSKATLISERFYLIESPFRRRTVAWRRPWRIH